MNSHRPISWNKFSKTKVHKLSKTVLDAGKFNGLCYRGACLSPIDVIWRHIHSTKHYCPKCAKVINDAHLAEYPKGILTEIL